MAQPASYHMAARPVTRFLSDVAQALESDVDAPDRPHGDSLLTICVATLRKLFHEFVQPHP